MQDPASDLTAQIVSAHVVANEVSAVSVTRSNPQRASGARHGGTSIYRTRHG